MDKFTSNFFVRKASENEQGMVMIYLRVTISGKRFVVSTSRSVRLIDWSQSKGRMLGRSNEAKELNDFLEALNTKVRNIQQRFIVHNTSVTVEEFAKQWRGVKEKSKMLLEIFKEHNDQVKQLIGAQYSLATWKRYVTSHDHTLHFLQQKYGLSDIPVKDIKYGFITDYEFWLKTIRKCNHNSTIKYLTNFKKIVFICLKNNWIDKNPFVGFKMAKKEVERPFLTNLELKAIAEAELRMHRTSEVRDAFLFCCYTGLAYVDLFQLKRSQIVIGVDGEKWIATHRQKTDAPSRIPLLPQALAILEKHEDNLECKIKDRLIPVLSNQKMNSYLKEIADTCGIQKTLTTHVARHTFATTVTLTNGVPIETVSRMLGHRNLKTTQHYAKILDQKVSEDMMKLRDKLKNG